MDKDEIKKIILDAIDSGAIQYTLETCNTGDCTLKLGPIYFKREIPPPPLDPNAKKYVILRGNETEKEREHIKKRLGGDVEFLPSCAEITPFAAMQCKITVNGRVIAFCDQRNVLMLCEVTL